MYQNNDKYLSCQQSIDQINLHDEDGYIETQKNKFIHNKSINLEDYTKKNNVWFTTVEKYLNSIEYAFNKGNKTGEIVSNALNNIPEPTSKKFVLRFTIGFSILVLIIFFSSCHKANAQYTENKEQTKGQEQLFIKRESLQIKSKEGGSTTGSIWSDAPQPKSLATEYQPTHTGEIVTVNIPESLQYKPGTEQPNSNTNQKYDPIKSLKFEIVGFEPGGDVYLRATKNYISESGEQRSIMVMAKIPQRNLNKFEINANDLTQLAVNSSINGEISDYSSAGWDLTTSRKISGFAPDLNSAIASLDGQKKELDIQQKSLKDQQKSITEETERLKKDRARLDSQTAQAKKILDSAAIIDSPDQDKKSNNGNNNNQSNKSGNQSGGNTKKP